MEKLAKFVISKQFILPVVYIILALIIYGILSSIITKFTKVKNNKINVKKQETVGKLLNSILKALIIIITFIMILNVYGINTTSIIASLGVIGVVVGLAFQDILKNLLSGILKIFDGHYSVGDSIEVNGFKGDVIELGLQTTKIKSDTGGMFIIDNSNITSVINYSLYNSKLTIDLNLDYDTDIGKLETILKKISKTIEKLDNVKGKLELLGIDSMTQDILIYKIAIDCKAMTQGAVKRECLAIIKKTFKKEKIKLSYNIGTNVKK